jgi:hypothetical protein
MLILLYLRFTLAFLRGHAVEGVTFVIDNGEMRG